ncbi:biliverdin-producing heme oxygenase [Cognatilysobacter bugurensis]|uniref:Heme oxygenase n=1 Tax=Cognatilysobacter bugurensis TaxID=543356 RepID=A0A918T3F0_9GAMM|nr:biliverdin-producing heme oxygenase [Lysobacter bugurensis]GHA87192.1 hypothetical protein GCM10007067_26330 [Lysobacter bugurensis]
MALLTRLRGATEAVHARIDARFSNGLLDAPSHACYLRGMQRTVDAFERGSARFHAEPEWRDWLVPARSPLLESDLAELELPALTLAPALEFDDGPGLLGALYVLEGSAQGARMMMHQLRQRPGPVGGVHFLQAHADDPRRWRALLARLDGVEDDGAAAASAELGAMRTFALAEDSFALAAERT